MNVDLIREWLKAKKHSQAWLAESLGVDTVTVNRWLTGKASIYKPCQILIRQLMQEDDSQKSPQGMHAPLTQEELSTAAQSIQRTPEGLINGVLGLLGKSALNNALPSDENKP